MARVALAAAIFSATFSGQTFAQSRLHVRLPAGAGRERQCLRVVASRPVRHRQPFPEPARRDRRRRAPRRAPATIRRAAARKWIYRPLPHLVRRLRHQHHHRRAGCFPGRPPQDVRRTGRRRHEGHARRHARRFGRPQHHRCRHARRERPHRFDAGRRNRRVRARAVDARRHRHPRLRRREHQPLRERRHVHARPITRGCGGRWPSSATTSHCPTTGASFRGSTFDWLRSAPTHLSRPAAPNPISGSSVTANRIRMLAGGEIGRSWLVGRQIFDFAVYGAAGRQSRAEHR